MSHSKDKWVIVFLIYADFRKNMNVQSPLAMTEQMKAELNEMLKDILTVPIDASRARLYVIINSIDYQEGDGSYTQAKTLFYEISNPHMQDYNQITFCDVISDEVGTFGTPDPHNPSQKPEFLKSIFTQNRIKVHDDEEVFFITWDHGSAFGIFREVDAGRVDICTPIDYDLHRYPYLAEFWYEALKKDKDLRELTNLKEKNVLPGLVQIGHKLFEVEATSDDQSLIPASILTGIDFLPMDLTETPSYKKTLWLVVNNETQLVKVIDDVDLSLVNTQLAKLIPTNVREILRNEELADVLKNWLGDSKVGVLLMMNCWMMNLHTIYSLQGSVKCLVAPQGDIGTPGYNYKDILKFLFKGKNRFITPQELAITCVTTSENKRMRRLSKRLRADQKDKIDSWKIIALDLQRNNGAILASHLHSLNEIIADLLSQNLEDPELLSLIQMTRLFSYDFTRYGSFGDSCFMIDIINWMNCLTDLSLSYPSNKEFPIGIDTVGKMTIFVNSIRSESPRENLMICTSTGRYIYNPKVAAIRFPPTGYSLCFPNDSETSVGIIDNIRSDSFLNKFIPNWKDFIKAVYSEDVWEPFFGDRKYTPKSLNSLS